MIAFAARHEHALSVVTAALVALVLVGCSRLVRYVKAGGERWEQRTDLEKRRLSMLPGFALLVIAGVVLWNVGL